MTRTELQQAITHECEIVLAPLDGELSETALQAFIQTLVEIAEEYARAGLAQTETPAPQTEAK